MNISAEKLKGRLRFCLKLVGSKNLLGKKVVDVGCSNGLFAYCLKDFGISRYMGFDKNKTSIDYARKNIPFGEFFVARANKLPVKSNFADFVFMFDVIEHVPKDSELSVFKEIHRVLKRGGKLFVTTPNSNFWTNFLDPAWYLGHRHYRQKHIKKFLNACGFKILKSGIVGNVWNSFYLIWFYMSKWIFGNRLFEIKFLTYKDDYSFQKPGIHTIYLVAKKP